MSLAVTITPPSALEALQLALSRYVAATGRDATAVLLQKGGQFLFGNRDPRFGAVFRGIFARFAGESPGDGRIASDARARGYRLGRKNFGSSLPGISRTALARALVMMGGFPSILVTRGAEGSVSFVRRGVTGRRVRFREGRKSFAVAGTETDRRFRTPDARRANLRAVATYFELQLRSHGRGFLASAWLQKRWRSFAKLGQVPAGTPGLAAGLQSSRQFGGTDRRLVVTNPRSSLALLGEAALAGDPALGGVSLRLSSHVPGTGAIGEHRGLFAAVLTAMTADIEIYLARRAAAAIRAEFAASAA